MERQKGRRQKVKTSSKGATDGKTIERGGIAIKEREKAGEEEGSRRRREVSALRSFLSAALI